MDREQKKLIGETIANLLHYSISWEEPMNGDDVEDIIEICKANLHALNGNE